MNTFMTEQEMLLADEECRSFFMEMVNCKKEQEVLFASKQHYNFYMEQTQELRTDRNLKAFIYTVGICSEMRENFNLLYNAEKRMVRLEAINDSWQTGSTINLTRLAFQLYTDRTPTAETVSGKGKTIKNYEECGLYSVSEIFACGYATFIVEAIKIRYPENFRSREVYRPSATQ